MRIVISMRNFCLLQACLGLLAIASISDKTQNVLHESLALDRR